MPPIDPSDHAYTQASVLAGSVSCICADLAAACAIAHGFAPNSDESHGPQIHDQYKKPIATETVLMHLDHICRRSCTWRSPGGRPRLLRRLRRRQPATIPIAWTCGLDQARCFELADLRRIDYGNAAPACSVQVRRAHAWPCASACPAGTHKHATAHDHVWPKRRSWRSAAACVTQI